jgi:hypothetical protein
VFIVREKHGIPQLQWKEWKIAFSVISMEDIGFVSSLSRLVIVLVFLNV